MSCLVSLSSPPKTFLQKTNPAKILTGMAHKLGPSDQTNGLSTPNKGHTLLLHMSGDLFRTQMKLPNPSGAFGAVTSPWRFTWGGDSGRLISTGMAHKLGPSDQTNGLSTPNKGHTLLLHMLGDLFRTQMKLPNPSGAFGAVTSPWRFTWGVTAGA